MLSSLVPPLVSSSGFVSGFGVSTSVLPGLFSPPLSGVLVPGLFVLSPLLGGLAVGLVAGLLGIFLGAWGVHNFYLGYTKKGILQIVLTIVTCGIAALWGFIEGILILCGNINTDANGNRLAE